MDSFSDLIHLQVITKVDVPGIESGSVVRCVNQTNEVVNFLSLYLYFPHLYIQSLRTVHTPRMWNGIEIVDKCFETGHVWSMYKIVHVVTQYINCYQTTIKTYYMYNS